MNQASVNLVDMNCGVEGHEGSKLVALCVDSNCSLFNKFVCLECIFQSHAQHKIIKLKLIEDKINNSLANQNQDEESQVLARLKITEEKIKIEMEKIKTNILEIFNIKINTFISEINDKIIEYYKNNRTDYFDVSILAQKDITYLTKDDLENLTKYLLSISQDSSSSESRVEKKLSPFTELDKFDDNFVKYITGVNKLVCEFLNTKLLVAPSNTLFSDCLYFEWCEKVYGSYGFLYQLSNNKLTATKIVNDSTITIVRARDKLNNTENYYIEFLIDCKKSGDIEVGFGKEAVGASCWIRTLGAYGVTNVGIYENGKVTKKDIKLQDGDIVGFELFLKTQKLCKVYLNSKPVHEFKVEIDEVYPMCAIRKMTNSVTVKDFKTLN